MALPALPAASHSRDLTDEQWVLIGPFLPKLTSRKDGRGRPWRENRAVLNGILWILRTGAPWADLPDRYPSYQTCHRRFQRWVRSGVLKDILSLVAEALHNEGYLDVQEAFIDGTFAPAKKGGSCVGKPDRTCGSCNDGWICEDHPDQPMGHEHCGGAGMPCQNPACPYREKRTGIVCPKCRRSQGEIELQSTRVIRLKCRGCSYVWWAEERASDTERR
jgi:transposase